MKREDYQEPEVKKNMQKIHSCVSSLSTMNIDEIIKTIKSSRILGEERIKGGMWVTIPSCFLDVFHVKSFCIAEGNDNHG